MTAGFHCGSLYVHDGIGIEHETNVELLHAVAGRLPFLQGPWALLGDFNCTPAELAATGFLRLVKGRIVHARKKTCTAGRERILDFFVVSEDMYPVVHGAFNIADAGASPHSPVRLIFGAKPRKDETRVMKVPKSHPPVMPHGPEQECRVEQAVAARTDRDLGSDYDG